MEAALNNEKMVPDKNVTLSQLYKVISSRVETLYISRLIDQQGDVNFIIPKNSIFEVKNPALVGSTLLHFAFAEGNGDAFDYLLGKGADYTIKNATGSTVLHQFIEEMLSDFLENNELRVQNTYVYSILQAHVKDKNFTNPCNKHGFSHFQVACATNNVEAVELFLKNGASADHAVNAGSPSFSGYTPLHFAARCGSVGAAEILLRYDASLQARDATGATPLYILMQKQLALIDEKNNSEVHDEEEFAEKIEQNERIIKLFLEFNENFENPIDDSGLSTFHIACIILDISTIQCLLTKISDINRSVKNDSLFWPGYTALHFAALSNIDTVKLLMENGADIQAKNTDGTSSFDICLERYELNDISHIISCHPTWKNIQFLSSEIKLVNFIYTLYNTNKLISMVQNFLISTQSRLPLDSPLWPGSTPLHVAVILFERPKATFYTEELDDEEEDSENDDESAINVLELFFNENYFRTANVLAQDAYGRTPIHLAFQMQQRRILNLLFKQQHKIENPIDIDNVSVLHIACLMGRQQLVQELLFIGEDVNMPILCNIQANLIGIDIISAGSTLLHMAILTGDTRIIEMLLISGADPCAQDINGITPLHLVLTSGYSTQSRMFVSLANLQNVEVTGGITYMHIACIAGDREAVRKLIELGADVNAPVILESETDGCSSKLAKLLTPHLGSTPLHYAFQYHSIDVAELLFYHGADIFVKNFGQPVPIVQILRKMCTRYTNIFLRNLCHNGIMQANLKNKTGLTLLHIACNALDVELVRLLLSNGSDVNVQAHSDAPVWPGCTALHVLLENLKDRLDIHGNSRNRYIDNVHVVLKLLMRYNADTTLMNTDKKTPIDISMELYRSHIRAKAWLCTMLPLGNHDYYDLTFVDNLGISLFQEACHQSNITVIEEFLKRGVVVNQRVDALASKFANYTPLHFAAQQRWQSMVGSSRHLETLELLLNHGADVHAKDIEDNTPFHIVVEAGSSREKLISKFIKFGADMNAPNMYGRTPFEVLLRSPNVSSAEVTVFLKNGARINSCNRITGTSYIPLIYKVNAVEFDAIISTIIENTHDITAADEEGRTVIHNLIFSDGGYPPHGLSSLCSRFIEYGCDIDQQDTSGKTALHIAVQTNYGDATEHLLILNANTTIVDNDGKTAMDYALEKCNCQEPCDNSAHIRQLFALQAFKLEITGFQEFTEYRDLKKSFFDPSLIENFRENLKIAEKTCIIPRELTLYNFASETGAISSYLHMPKLKRNIIDEFFKSMKDDDPVTGHYVHFWLKNHYRKALERPSMDETAKQSLNNLIGFPLPHLCLDSILRFLSNVELKYLIAAGTEDSDNG